MLSMSYAVDRLTNESQPHSTPIRRSRFTANPAKGGTQGDGPRRRIRQWEIMCSRFGFSLDAPGTFMLNGVEAAWIDEGTRHAWNRAWAAEHDAIAMTLRDAQA